MPAASILIKPASSACNMACRYCFYHEIAEGREVPDRGRMADGVLEELVRQAMAYAEGLVTFAFQGGEPTLAGLPFFRRAVELQRELARPGLQVQNTIQTNGTLVDDEWAEFFRENGFLVGLSIDGPERLNDAARVTTGGSGTHARVMRTVRTLRKHGVDFNVLSVVTSRSATRAGEIYRFMRKNRFDYLQFIPCMSETPEHPNPWAVEPEAYGRFLCSLFDLWYPDFMAGHMVDIRMFSNLAQMAAGFAPEECGMCGRCTTYFAVESDGSVYPCDFYTSDEWRLGSVGDGLAALYASEKSRRFMEESVPKPAECLTCPWFALCRGGCRRWRDGARTGAGPSGLGVNYLCPGYKLFFEHCADRIVSLGAIVRRNVGL